MKPIQLILRLIHKFSIQAIPDSPNQIEKQTIKISSKSFLVKKGTDSKQPKGRKFMQQ